MGKINDPFGLSKQLTIGEINSNVEISKCCNIS